MTNYDYSHVYLKKIILYLNGFIKIKECVVCIDRAKYDFF